MLIAATCPPGARANPTTSLGYRAPEIKYPGLQHLTFRYGPVAVRPGQNTIEWSPVQPGPRVPGFITRFQPDLVYADSGKSVPGALLHLHHVQWKVDDTPLFPAGAEKSIIQFPRGFGYPLEGSEMWRTNYMIHNLTPAPTRVYILWRISYLPKAASAAQLVKPIDIRWLDVVGKGLFLIFPALRGQGRNGRYTFPDQATPDERKIIGRSWYWEVPEDVTLVYNVSHLHPGALFNSLYVKRGPRKRMLFRSRAKYFDSRGPVSWDLAATASTPAWRIKLRRGDLLTMNTTVDTSRASWRESMGNFLLAVYYGHDVGGQDAFAKSPAWPLNGRVTHGPLPGNRSLGGQPSALADPRSLPNGPELNGALAIKGFRYKFGDLSSSGLTSRPPVVRRGASLTFVNFDSTRLSSSASSIYHTITACRAPCTASTGLAYPLEDGRVNFDSGQLGFSDANLPPAEGRNTWSTPRDLSPGTYTFFCRIHPFMRGAFRVSSEPAVSPISPGWSTLPAS